MAGVLPDRTSLVGLLDQVLAEDGEVSLFALALLWTAGGLALAEDPNDPDEEVRIALAVDELTDRLANRLDVVEPSGEWQSDCRIVAWHVISMEGSRVGVFARLVSGPERVASLYGIVTGEEGWAVEAEVIGPVCTVARSIDGGKRMRGAQRWLTDSMPKANAIATRPSRSKDAAILQLRALRHQPSEPHDIVEPPLAWAEYSTDLIKRWKSLLSAEDVDERRAHMFLVYNPCLIPFATSAEPFGSGHHGALHHAVFSKPRLGPASGGEMFIPDFMRITTDSGAVHIHLIEIESPRKRILNRAQQLTAKYGQAMSQLADWMGWLDNGNNVEEFRRLYGIRALHVPLSVDYTLIYGRRAELAEAERGRRQRELLSPPGAQSMTYDRLVPLEAASDDVTVSVRAGRLTAIAVQPTMRCTSLLASRLMPINGLTKAIGRNRLIPSGRRHWMISEYESLRARLEERQPTALDGFEHRP